jgi:hypothetical protein
MSIHILFIFAKNRKECSGERTRTAIKECLEENHEISNLKRYAY